MNRLTRDQVLTRALDMVDSPTLNSKDRPSGALLPTALCIGWLQDGLDFFVHKWPFGGTINTATITWVTGQETYDLPTDYIQDVRDGVIHQDDQGRMIRKGLPYLLDIAKTTTSQQGKPAFYAIVGPKVYIRPVPSSSWSGKTATLYYYQLPPVLGPSTVPNFPSDLVLVRYTYLRGLEWSRSVPPGTAESYATQVISELQKSGIGNEAEDTQIPFDRSQFPGSRPGTDPNSWMGNPIIAGP